LVLSKVGERILNWEPFHESHSIELAAVQVTFSEPLTDIAWRKVVRGAEATCKAAGLTEKSAINVVQFTIGPQGAAAQAVPAAVDGMLFKRSTTVETSAADGKQNSIVVVAESFTVSRSGLNYQTTAYTRWNAFFDRVVLLLRPALREALHAVRTASLRLEYKDSFRFRGNGAPLAADLLSQGSALIAPQVFLNEKLWHSHTGFFEDVEGCEARLVQINIDANMMTSPTEAAPFRTVSITTAVQNNLRSSSEEDLDNEEDQVRLQLEMFDSLHLRSISLFKEIISSEAAIRVGME
jgi:uncharacterized protein (TIGR04255 family)